jgi:hypothetical protein
MKNIRDTCVEFFQSEDIRKSVKEIIKPIANIVYNEMYLYIWIILFYNVFLIFLILANLGLLIKLLQMQGTASSLSIALPQINI